MRRVAARLSAYKTGITELSIRLLFPAAMLLFSAAAKAQEDTLSLRETHAEFPGGWDALRKYLKDNMVYPQYALENGLEGKCYLRFTITTTGAVSNISVLRGVRDCPECDKEAVRVFRSMPPWKPATKGGEPVESACQLPVIFGLH